MEKKRANDKSPSPAVLDAFLSGQGHYAPVSSSTRANDELSSDLSGFAMGMLLLLVSVLTFVCDEHAEFFRAGTVSALRARILLVQTCS